MLKQLVQKWLADLARKIIAKHNPKIIGITGSVGKTSTRDAIYAVVSTAFSARKGNKNFNNELGMPFAILGADSPGRNIVKWLWVFLKGYIILYIGSYPQVLILEMGVDKPGDMDYLLSIAKPDIAVLTYIGLSHYEFFHSREAVALEKSKLLSGLRDNGAAIINGDNDLVKQQANKAPGKVISYGFDEGNDVQISVLEERLASPAATNIKVHTHFSEFEARVNGIGKPHVASCAAAIAVGLNLNISVDHILEGLERYKPSPGRLNILKGIKQSIIIEDSYNASPTSMKEALAILSRMPQQQKVAVLGDMLELGDISQSSHEEIGSLVVASGVSRLITVGPQAKIILDSAVAHGFDEQQAHWFPTSSEAKDFVRETLAPATAILIKGSQGVRMEKISKEILLEPQSAPQYLPRQYGKWLEN